MIEFEFPLKWLPQQPRTKNPPRARFGNHNPSKAGDCLIRELSRLGSKHCVISSNLQPRARGDGFYANQNVEDPGIVVYFQLKGKSKAMACDSWDKVEHNLWALFLSVQAIRGLERWGGSEFLDGLFGGFTALPGPEDIIYSERNFFEGSDIMSFDKVKSRFKELVKELHPDVNPSKVEDFKLMNEQYKKLKLSYGVEK